ncbi:fimbrial biogenesis outer membrane usher protein [Lysobacter sp. S4-A87]|uniref:fimbria/pilus outer membrane usher protein n=1 Tax=Lysobacter sp. S4-A87 TaxID=2925843 RepID=UPI001F5315E3|nr:fimbria/pilus outer membrane usher protein [Lysobacter sp. S4-A87]UNK48143.1 fimbrial biogenesis outer membrane usher protein [Lysobacter sp. S4-A87]
MRKQHRNHQYPRLRPISLAVAALLTSGGAGAWTGGPNADDSGTLVEFNEAFLHAFEGSGGNVDLSRFARGNAALPGTYLADLQVNQQLLGKAEITLRPLTPGGDNVQPCFDLELIGRLGLDMTKLTPESMARLEDSSGDTCVTLPSLIEGASAVFDNGEQRLDISVPQAALDRHARGYVDPRFWDEGINAFRLQYNANAYRAESQGNAITQGYVGINAGANIGPWRLRHIGNFSYDENNGGKYDGVQTYAQRSLIPIKSQLTIGDAYTDGTIFDSFGFRGVQLASDDRMYPESQRGYAPTIHGIANSNARVQVRQGGSILYETNVAPGAFEIDDLYPSGYGGDLEVVVTEADGSVNVSKVPYSAAVNALRPGIGRYSLTAGLYRHPTVDSEPELLQGTYQRGLSNGITAYGGATVTKDYQAVAVGSALNTRFGAIGLDITRSNAKLDHEPDRSGQSVRLSYSKLVAPTNTNLTLAAYRYSSEGFLDLEDAVALNARAPDDLLPAPDRERGRLQLTVNQTLPAGWGSFYLTGSRQDYWNRRETDTQYQLGYNNTYKRINFGFSASRQFDLSRGDWDNRVMFTVGIPLGSGPRAPYSQTSLQRDSSGAATFQESVTGTLGRDSAFSYGLNASHNRGVGVESSSTYGANASYALPSATITGSASKSNNYSQVSAGVSGGIVAYAGGVTFTPTLGDTVAIVEAKGAKGAIVSNGSGLRVDRWGHAVVSNLSPFTRSSIDIDPNGLPLNVQLDSTQEQTVPTSGAITLVRFETSTGGRAAILRTRLANGEPLPFGADVLDAQGLSIGTVAQGGKVIARSLGSDSGELTARWGTAADETCKLRYSLPKVTNIKMGYTTADATCN